MTISLVSGFSILTRQVDQAIKLSGPVAEDHRWQAQAGAGFAAAQLVVDWERQGALCPQGHTSVEWLERREDHGQTSIQIKFPKADCTSCPVCAQCTQSKEQPRFLQVRDERITKCFRPPGSVRKRKSSSGGMPRELGLRKRSCRAHGRGTCKIAVYRLAQNALAASADCRRAELHPRGRMAGGNAACPHATVSVCASCSSVRLTAAR